MTWARLCSSRGRREQNEEADALTNLDFTLFLRAQLDFKDHGGGHAAGREACEGQEEEGSGALQPEHGQETQEGGDEMEGSMVRPGGQEIKREGFERSSLRKGNFPGTVWLACPIH